MPPGLGRFGLCLRSALGLRCFRRSQRHGLGLQPGGLGLRGGFRLQSGGLGRGGRFGLRLDSGGLGHRLGLGSRLGFRLDPGGLGHRLGLGSRLDLRLDPGRLGGLGLGERRSLGFRRGGRLGLRSGLDLGPQPRLDIRLDGVDRRRCTGRADPGEAGHDVDVPRVIGRAGVDRGRPGSIVFVGDIRGRPGQRVQRRNILAGVRDGGVSVGVGDHRATGEVEIGEGGREHVFADERSARQAAPFGRVPAVAARVLPARHAEVEGLVERVELLRRDLAVGLVARRGEGLVHGGVVRHDEVLETARQDSHTLEAGDPRNRGLERVASAATFAE